MTVMSMIFCAAIGISGPGGCRKPQKQADKSSPIISQRWPQDPPLTTRAEIVIVGDSIMAQLPMTGRLTGAINHAIPGQPIINVAQYLNDDALIYRPKILIVEGGINDFNQDPDVTTDRQVQNRLQILRAGLSIGARVYMVNISQFDTSDPRMANATKCLDKIAQVNNVLAAMCSDGTQCTLVDMNRALGPWNITNFMDSVHPSDAGNALILEELNRVVR